MTGILGMGSNAQQATALGTLQFQTSQVGGVIPLVYGSTRIAVNLLDYQDFTAIPVTPKQQKGKGSADAKGQGKYTYTASLILGICQGPVNFGLIWWDKNICPLTALPGLSSINTGADDQAPDPYWETNHPLDAIGYSGTANFTADNYQLGYSGALPNFTVEVLGIGAGTAVNECDANPSFIVTDFLTNSRYGAGFPTANLDSSGTIASYGQYCDAAGIFLSPQLDQQTQGQAALANIAQLTVSAIVWSGGLLKVIPYGDAPISATYWVIGLTGTTSGGDTLTLTFSSSGLGTVAVSYQAQPANVNTDTTDNSAPMGRLAQQVNGNGTLGSYGITAGVGVGTCVIRMAGSDQSVTVTPSATGGESFNIYGPFQRSWTPVTTIEAVLDDDDFIVQESSVGAFLGVTPGSPALRQGAGPITGGFTDDPVRVSRSSPADAMNYVALEVLDRAYSYNTQLVETFDQASVDLYGVRKDTSLKARAIADPAMVGATVAQLLLQRNIAYRNTYTFQLGWQYCLLEPMDLVQITDTYLGLNNQTVRITSVVEDEEGTLTFTAEDYFGASTGGGSPGTVAQAPPKQGFGQGTTAPFFNAAAPPVGAPFIFEPTPQLLQAQGLMSIAGSTSTGPSYTGTPYVIIGLSAPGAVFGGAQVYASLDGVSYGPQGSFIGRSTMGVTTTSLSASGTSVTVDLTQSAGAGPPGSQTGTLSSTSALLAANGVSLCALRNASGQLELLSYQTATLVSGNKFTLSGLNRGLYGTTAVSMPIGSQFLYLANGEYYAQVMPPQYNGQTLSFKFPSFNLTMGGGQSLSAATAYGYQVQGQQGSNPNVVIAHSPMPFEHR